VWCFREDLPFFSSLSMIDLLTLSGVPDTLPVNKEIW